MKSIPYFVVGILLISSIATIGIGREVGDLAESRTVSFQNVEVINEDEYIKINLAGTNGFNYVEGEPLLPTYKETLTLPFGVKVTDINCEVNTLKTIELTDKIIPAPQMLIKGTVTQSIKPVENEDIYSTDQPFPESWFDYKIGVGLDENNQHKTFFEFTGYPCRYNPMKNILTYAEKLEFTVTYNDPEINPFPTNADFDLVIIAPQKFESDLQPLVEHKNNYGVNSFIKTTEDIYNEYPGVDKPEQIKYFIKDAIEQNGVKYCLLVGGLKNLIYAKPMDTENYGVSGWNLPVRWANLDYHEPGPLCDLYYSDVYKAGGVFDDWNSDGDDLIGEWKNFGGDKLDLHPDINLGRLACRNNNEVKSVVDKIINYESNAYGSSWFNKMIAVAGDGFLDQEDLDIQWDTNGLPDGDYIIYDQSNDDSGNLGPIEEINIKLAKSQATSITFNHDDYTRVPNYPTYPAPPMSEIVSVTEGDILGNSDYSYTPSESEAYLNDQLGWANIEYDNGILHIRGKTYDPVPYGVNTDMHVWIENSNGKIVFEDWRNDNAMYSEGDWTVGEKMLLGRAGGLYYMPSNFVKEKLFSSNGNWYGEDDVINAINQGSGFVFFSGHGSPAVWANHYPGIPGNRRVADVDGLAVIRFNGLMPSFPMNQLSNNYKLPVVVVGGCHNSMFTPSLILTLLDTSNQHNTHTYGTPVAECWSWLPVRLSKTGAIATIGNTGYGYGYLGEYCTSAGVDNWITTEFFVQYGTNGIDILGEAHSQTLVSYMQNIGLNDEGDAKTVMQWVLLGDPSLKLGGYQSAQDLSISVLSGDGITDGKPGDTINIKANSGQTPNAFKWDTDFDGDFDDDVGTQIQEIWTEPGVYWVGVKAIYEDREETYRTIVNIEAEQGPSTPLKPSGPAVGLSSNTQYTYSTKSNDQYADEIYYVFDWGDDTTSYSGPYNSGETGSASHSWSKFGTYKVKVIAVNDQGKLSSWSNELTVSITKDKSKNLERSVYQLIQRLLEMFPNCITLFSRLANLN